jgi:hypothetical protein
MDSRPTSEQHYKDRGPVFEMRSRVAAVAIKCDQRHWLSSVRGE